MTYLSSHKSTVRQNPRCMNANGPAIKGGCATWRSHRPAVPVCFSLEILPVARQVWRAFCRLTANFIGLTRGRGTTWLSDWEIVPVDETGRGQARSGRGTKLSRRQ
jgi:hypothetical protein